MSVICGIDPGVSGGIAVLGTDYTFTLPMPEDIDGIYRYFSSVRIDTCYIERVHSSPQMGPAQAFKFGKNFGTLLGCLEGLQIKTTEVQPEVWMRAMGCVSKKIDKNGTKKLAQKLFPDIKVTHKIADALLIAEYGRRKEVNSD